MKIIVRRMGSVFVAHREDRRFVALLPVGTSTGIGRSEAEAIGHLILAIALEHPNEWPGLEVERK